MCYNVIRHRNPILHKHMIVKVSLSLVSIDPIECLQLQTYASTAKNKTSVNGFFFEYLRHVFFHFCYNLGLISHNLISRTGSRKPFNVELEHGYSMAHQTWSKYVLLRSSETNQTRGLLNGHSPNEYSCFTRGHSNSQTLNLDFRPIGFFYKPEFSLVLQLRSKYGA